MSATWLAGASKNGMNNDNQHPQFRVLLFKTQYDLTQATTDPVSTDPVTTDPDQQLTQINVWPITQVTQSYNFIAISPSIKKNNQH